MQFLTVLAVSILAIFGVMLLIAYVVAIVKIANAFEKAANSFDEFVQRK